MREIIIFAVLNGVGLLLQDSVVAANFYLLHLGQDKLAAFVALNSGIALATLFRFWSYRQFVWGASPARAAGSAGKSSSSPPCGRDGGRSPSPSATRARQAGSWLGSSPFR